MASDATDQLEVPISSLPLHAPKRKALQLYARFGYASRGVVYLLVGGLATLAAFTQGGETTGSRGALERLLSAPAGDILLIVVAIGLVGHSLWRCLQSVFDADAHGRSAKGLTIRAGLLISSVTHALLAMFALSLIFTIGQSGGQSGGGSTAGWLMQQPLGRWLVALVGVVLIGAGFAHMAKAYKEGFDKHFAMPASTQRWAYPVCRFGLATRGVVFIIAGVLFVIAGWQGAPQEAGGTPEVFSLIRHQAFGQWLLGIVAVGLFAFGLYSLLLSVYRLIDPEPKG